MQQVIVFSHGFGVRGDSRGMFPEVAAGLPKTVPLTFDYVSVDSKGNTTVPPLSDQAKKLLTVLEETRKTYPEAVIDLIAHSQGCVVAGLAQPQGLRRIILLAPPSHVSTAGMQAIFGIRPGATFDPESTSILPRTDGTITYLPADYFKGLDSVKPVELYNQLARRAEVTLVHANQEDILKHVDFSGLNTAVRQQRLDGDHNFSGAARSTMIAAVRKLLT